MNDDQDGEDDDAGLEEPFDLLLEVALRFHHQEDAAVHGEEGHRREAQQDGVGVQQAQESSCEVAPARPAGCPW